MAAYVYENAWHEARRRLALIEAVYDPGSLHLLETLGVGDGWRCLEVACGAGSVAAWLAQRVGPRGVVLPTDIDTRCLAAVAAPNLEVRRHDIVADPLPVQAFDLIHTRCLLHHLADCQSAQRRMAAAVKPGGWLVVEEADDGVHLADPGSGEDVVVLLDRVSVALRQVLRGRGGDSEYGRRLYRDMRALGLREPSATGRVPVLEGGSAAAEVFRLSFVQVREQVVGTGVLTATELDQLLEHLADPEFVALFGLVVAVWGRRPATP